MPAQGSSRLASLPVVAQGRVAQADPMIRASVTIAGGATLTIVPTRSRYRSRAGPPRRLGMSGMVLGWAPHVGPIVLLLGEADAIEHGIDDSSVAVLGDSTAIHRDCSLLPGWPTPTTRFR